MAQLHLGLKGAEKKLDYCILHISQYLLSHFAAIFMWLQKKKKQPYIFNFRRILLECYHIVCIHNVATRTQKRESFDSSRVMLHSQLVQIISKSGSLMPALILNKNKLEMSEQWKKSTAAFIFLIYFIPKSFFSAQTCTPR